ncbi:MAG TPA: hypothetical protein DCF93_01140 [Desulfuromonas sp.]|nr:hypothetical protein [Desulfuromonas sp.]
MSQERVVRVANGWIVLPLVIALLLAGIASFVLGVVAASNPLSSGLVPLWVYFVFSALAVALSIIGMFGFFTLQPNEARVLILFGNYKGTVRKDGFHWGNPFYSNGSATQTPSTMEVLAKSMSSGSEQKAGGPRRRGRYRISLRARTLNVEKLKVNDKQGNPIEIGTVVVWRVKDTAQAVFDVDDYKKYVAMQSESALRHVATAYAYDHGDDIDISQEEITLRSNIQEVSDALLIELGERLGVAGIEVNDARLTHLAYAPEIAQVMLRRQQAEAVIAARRKIVHGAVSMVEMALSELAAKGVVDLDDERRAAMVSNLMVVLCGESEVHPIVNAGTLYS